MLGDKRYQVQNTIYVGNYYKFCTYLLAMDKSVDHATEINMTTTNRCMPLICLHVLHVSVWMSAIVSSTTQTQTHLTLTVFSASAVSIYEDGLQAFVKLPFFRENRQNKNMTEMYIIIIIIIIILFLRNIIQPFIQFCCTASYLKKKALFCCKEIVIF